MPGQEEARDAPHCRRRTPRTLPLPCYAHAEDSHLLEEVHLGWEAFPTWRRLGSGKEARGAGACSHCLLACPPTTFYSLFCASWEFPAPSVLPHTMLYCLLHTVFFCLWSVSALYVLYTSLQEEPVPHCLCTSTWYFTPIPSALIFSLHGFGLAVSSLLYLLEEDSSHLFFYGVSSVSEGGLWLGVAICCHSVGPGLPEEEAETLCLFAGEHCLCLLEEACLAALLPYLPTCQSLCVSMCSACA